MWNSDFCRAHYLETEIRAAKKQIRDLQSLKSAVEKYGSGYIDRKIDANQHRLRRLIKKLAEKSRKISEIYGG